MGAGAQPVAGHGVSDRDAELLERFESGRCGEERGVTAAEKELGRQGIREALEMEEKAARAQRGAWPSTKQVLVDLAVAASAQTLEEQRDRGKKRKRCSCRSSSSASGSVRMLDRGGDNCIARRSPRGEKEQQAVLQLAAPVFPLANTPS
eukprot:6477618-Amphidinium_carterae.5